MRNSARVVLLLVLIAAFALRLHELTKQNIWWDEARNIDVALRPFWQIPTAPELDIHPPVYFWLLHLWSRLLGLGDSTQLNVAAIAQPNELTFIVRSLSAFMNVLGIALLAHLARLWPGSGTTIGLFAVGIASAAPFWLAESQETRMYTLGFTLILAGAICLLRTTIRSIPSNQQERLLSQPHLKSPTNLLFILFAALSLLTHYNALFIVVAWYLWWGGWALLRPNRWLWIRHITITGLLMSAVVLPIAPIALRQIPGYSNPNLTVPTIAEYFTANWRAYFGGYAFPPNQQGLVSSDALWSGWLWTIGGIVLLGLLLIFWQSFSVVAAIFTENASNPPTSKQPPSKPAASKSTVTLGHVNGNLRQITKVQQQTILSFLLVWLIGGLGLYYIAVIDRGAFNPRYSSFVTPALYLLVALALSAWTFKSPLVGKAASIVGLAIIGFGFVPSVHADLYDDRFAREDMAQTVSWLNENAGWGDIIFVDQKYPFGFYYDRFVIGADEDYPVGSTTEKRPPARYLFVDINTIDQRLNQWAATADRIYWLQWFESDTDPR